MEYASSVWQISIIALLAGILIGVLAYRLLSPSVKQAEKVKSDLNQARTELKNYKTSVGQHFDKTSELFSNLTKDYIKVYQHLADGAQTLSDGKTFTNLLEQHQARDSIARDSDKNIPDEIPDDSFSDSVVAEDLTADPADAVVEKQ